MGLGPRPWCGTAWVLTSCSDPPLRIVGGVPLPWRSGWAHSPERTRVRSLAPGSLLGVGDVLHLVGERAWLRVGVGSVLDLVGYGLPGGRGVLQPYYGSYQGWT